MVGSRIELSLRVCLGEYNHNPIIMKVEARYALCTDIMKTRNTDMRRWACGFVQCLLPGRDHRPRQLMSRVHCACAACAWASQKVGVGICEVFRQTAQVQRTLEYPSSSLQLAGPTCHFGLRLRAPLVGDGGFPKSTKPACKAKAFCKQSAYVWSFRL